MFQIIRIVFWAFIISQVLLLFAHRFIRVPVTQKGLKTSFFLKVLLIVAYALYINITLYPEESAFGFFAFFSQMMMRCFAYLFEIVLCILVGYAFMLHTVKKDKTYQMADPHAEQSAQNTYNVYGTICEGEHDFDVWMSISEDNYLLLCAAGYFDKAGTQKTLPVRYRNFSLGSEAARAPIEVTLYNEE